MEPRTFTAATLYLTSEFMGNVLRIDCRDITIESPVKYAQYDNAIKVTWTPKGKRKRRERYLTYKPFGAIVPTSQAIDPDGMYDTSKTSTSACGTVESTPGRYSGFDARWVSDFATKLAAANVTPLWRADHDNLVSPATEPDPSGDAAEVESEAAAERDPNRLRGF